MDAIWVVTKKSKSEPLQVLSFRGTQGPRWDTPQKRSCGDHGVSLSAMLFTAEHDANETKRRLKQGHITHGEISVKTFAELLVELGLESKN
jgi:hypothetical protein